MHRLVVLLIHGAAPPCTQCYAHRQSVEPLQCTYGDVCVGTALVSSAAVMKHCPRATYQRAGFIWLALWGHSPSLREQTWGQNSNRKLMAERHRRALLAGSLSGSGLVSFLKETRVTCLGNVLPTVGRALLHQLIIKTIPQRCDIEANPIKTTTQLRLRWL